MASKPATTGLFIAEIERHIQVIVKADIAKVCEHYAEDRAKFSGNDEAFVKNLIDEESGEFVREGSSNMGDGFVVEEEDDDVEVHFYGIA